MNSSPCFKFHPRHYEYNHIQLSQKFSSTPNHARWQASGSYAKEWHFYANYVALYLNVDETQSTYSENAKGSFPNDLRNVRFFNVSFFWRVGNLLNVKSIFVRRIGWRWLRIFACRERDIILNSIWITSRIVYYFDLVASR